jgi:predicted DNA-binding protein with PD1-like motif
VAWMDREQNSYKAIPIPQQVEVLSMVGVAMFEGKPAVHTHLVVGLEDVSAKGGHLIEAHVFPTLEVIVTVDPVTMQKRFDPETGLALIDAPAREKFGGRRGDRTPDLCIANAALSQLS